jgi:hypothetical protein
MSEEMDRDFANTFGMLAGSNAAQVEDAPATLDDGDVSLDNSSVDDSALTNEANLMEEPPVQDLGDDTPADEVNWEEKFNALQNEYDKLDKQKRDYQSHNDSRFAELQRQINENSTKRAEETPAKEYTKEELSDLQYDDPDAYFAEMMKRQGLQQPQPQNQQSQIDIETRINLGVERALHDDYDAMLKLAEDAAKYRPELMQEVANSTNRAKAAYEIGKRIKETQEQALDPVAYKEKIRQEILAEQGENKPNPKTLHKVPGARTPKQSKKRAVSDGFGFGKLAGSRAK